MTKDRLDRAIFEADNPDKHQDLPQGEDNAVVVEPPGARVDSADTPPSFIPIPASDRVIDVNLEPENGVQARRGPAHDGRVRVIDVDNARVIGVDSVEPEADMQDHRGLAHDGADVDAEMSHREAMDAKHGNGMDVDMVELKPRVDGSVVQHQYASLASRGGIRPAPRDGVCVSPMLVGPTRCRLRRVVMDQSRTGMLVSPLLILVVLVVRVSPMPVEPI